MDKWEYIKTNYIDKGLKIFPIVRDGKTPLIDKWQEECSCDYFQVLYWYTNCKDCNWGLPCTPNNLFVLDLDVHDENKNGIDNLNKILQDIFNPKDATKNEYKYGDVIFRENDKVLQLVNVPDDNVFNGDIGVISSIRNGNYTKSGKSEITIDFDGNLVTYQPKDLGNIKHGFIISIHKSQGGGFNFGYRGVKEQIYAVFYTHTV